MCRPTHIIYERKLSLVLMKTIYTGTQSFEHLNKVGVMATTDYAGGTEIKKLNSF